MASTSHSGEPPTPGRDHSPATVPPQSRGARCGLAVNKIDSAPHLAAAAQYERGQLRRQPATIVPVRGPKDDQSAEPPIGAAEAGDRYERNADQPAETSRRRDRMAAAAAGHMPTVGVTVAVVVDRKA